MPLTEQDTTLVMPPEAWAGTDRPVLRISILGGMHMTFRGQEVPLMNVKARAMLGYLTLNPARKEQREKLVGLFWSESGEDKARANLRQALSVLRKSLDAICCTAVSTPRDSVGLVTGTYVVDIDEIFDAIARRETPEALLRQGHVAETLLAGFDDLDPSFNVWLSATRQTLHDRLVRALEDAYRDQATERRGRKLLAEAALLLDPTNEEACRIVMRALAQDGETGAALRAYEQLYQVLGDEYDMEPSAATTDLMVEVKQGHFEPVPTERPGQAADAVPDAMDMRPALVSPRRAVSPSQASPVAAKPALFIEKFSMSGVDPGRAHLVDGFRFELIACLTRFREWYVAEAPTNAPTGVAISASYAVTTTAYQAGSVINVVMVLQERPSNLAIWGERFELSLEGWAEVQHRIVRRIAATLNVELSTERLVRLSHVPDVSLEAYDTWLRGQWVIRNVSVPDWNRTADMFARGIEQAPRVSQFYSSLAQMNNVVHFVQPGLRRDPKEVARTVELAQRAVALDPRDSRAELCLGWALAFSRRYATAELHMDLASQLNSNDPWTLVSSAMFHAFCGNVARARDLAGQAMEISVSPTTAHWLYEASIRFLRRDYQGAIDAVDRAQSLILTLPVWRAAALARLGRSQEAGRDVEVFYETVSANWIQGEAPTKEMMCRWFMEVFPISRRDLWLSLQESLAQLGMPVQGLVHTCPPLDR